MIVLSFFQVECYEEILIETINLCCYYFENNMYMVPKEKYMLLKVCVCAYVHVCACACMCMHVRVCTYVCVHVCVCVRACVYAHE